MLSCLYFEILYFELLDPEILTNNLQSIFYFELLGPELTTNNMNKIFGVKRGSEDHFFFVGCELREAIRMRFYRGLHRKIAR